MTPALAFFNVLRFTPLDAGACPDLSAGFIADADTDGTGLELVAQVDLCEEPESALSSWRVRHYDVTLSVAFPDYAMQCDAEALLERLRAGTGGMTAAAVEGWAATRAGGVWGYTGIPWLSGINHMEGFSVRELYQAPEGLDRVMALDLCTGHTRMGAAPWPTDAEPVLEREGGAREPLPSGLATHYVIATTPIAPPRREVAC